MNEGRALLTASEIDACLDEAGAPLPGAPLGLLLTAQAAREPNRPALTVGDVTLSRAELEAAANRRGRRFADLGVRQDDVVVVALPNGREFYEAVLATWKLGATPLHVSHRLTDVEFAEILELASPKLVVGGPVGPRSTGVRIAPGELVSEDIPGTPLAPRIAKAWKIATTGGSTGRPKLVVDAFPSTWGEEKVALGRKPGATVLNAAPLYHSAPFGLIIPGLVQGCHIVEMGRFDPEEWLRLVTRHHADWVYLAPTMMTRIARLAPEVRAQYGLKSIRTLLHMAAPCPDWVKLFWIDALGADAVWEIYGGAERFGSTMIGGEEWLAHPGSVGRARPGIEIAILDEGGRRLQPGEVGEIYFRRSAGPVTSLRSTSDDARQRGDWASFGDLGRLDAGGYLYIADRRTDMIVSGGANLYPAEIEAALEAYPGVLGAVVIGLPDNDLGLRAHAILQVDPGAVGAFDEKDVLQSLRNRLAVTKHPRSMEFTTRSLRDDAGKVRRSAWRDEAVARQGGRLPD